MKRYFWGFALILATVTINTTVAMAKPKEIISLNYKDKRPEISVYKWSSEKAISLVTNKKQALITLLGFENIQEWQEVKQETKRPDCFDPAWYPEGLMPKKLKACICRVLEYPQVQDALGVIDIQTEHDSKNNIKKITAETEQFGTVEFRASRLKNFGTATISKNVHLIFFDSDKIKASGALDHEIEALIGHELAHVIHDDLFDEYLALKFYKQKISNFDPETPMYKTITCKYQKIFSEYLKVCEVAADIVGTFGNPKWIQGLATLCKRIDLDFQWIESSKHPTPKQRIEYMKKIYNLNQ